MVRERDHIAMIRENADGTQTPLTIPNHRTSKSSTLRAICHQARFTRADFLNAYRTTQSLASPPYGD
jgi:hypothetical protein